MIRRTIFTWLIPIIALGMLGFAATSLSKDRSTPKQEPTVMPMVAQFAHQVGGLGMIEPRSENINISTEIQGVVRDVHVKVGDKVKKGAPLFSLDNREADSQLDAAKAMLESAKVAAADAKFQLSLFENVKDKRAISKDELSQKRYAYKLAQARVKEAEAQVKVWKTTLSRLTVGAPISGEILRINIRAGEFAQAGVLRDPLMIMGDTATMHVRVEVDESDALKVTSEAKAVASVRGYPDRKVDLTFVRKEPYVIPKRSLSGDGSERVDTRVQQVIYAFDNAKIGTYVGQQMDVTIESAPEPEKTPAP
jgi:HlyD family secretion protein